MVRALLAFCASARAFNLSPIRHTMPSFAAQAGRRFSKIAATEATADPAKADLDLAYVNIVIGRGEQLELIMAEHGISYNFRNCVGFGGDFVKNDESATGSFPWLDVKDEGFKLTDTTAMVQYLVQKYPGPATPRNLKEEVMALDAWAWCQDYYSFFLSPYHDTILSHNEPHWRNVRNTDPRAKAGEPGHEDYIAELHTLHDNRTVRLENKLEAMGTEYMAGDELTYADLFLYTCVESVNSCGGFATLRDARDGDAFAACPKIKAIHAKVGARPKVAERSAKYKEAPF